MKDRQPGELGRIRDIAAKYAAWGYEIVLDPSGRDLPEFLAGYRPDFLARLGDETVLVEVKLGSAGDQLERYQDLAELVRGHPGWRLDLVVANEPGAPFAGYPVLPPADIPRRYDEALRLEKLGFHDAALLMAWAATEAALRLLAERNGIPVQRAGTATLLTQLVSLGVISRDQYGRLWESLRARNAVAHGFAATEPGGETQSLIDVGRELFRETQEAA